VLTLLFLVALVGQTPDSHGEIVLDVPVYHGVRANAAVPGDQQFRNEGGSDGSGLCVIASVTIDGAFQRLAGFVIGRDAAAKILAPFPPLWAEAKKRPGGYYPKKLEDLVNEVLPDEKWTSYTERDPAAFDKILHAVSATGRPIGATMNTGALYKYQPIHHMVSLIHYQSGADACVVDNNDPAVVVDGVLKHKYHWMPAAEFLRRTFDGGEGWAFVWSRLPLVARVAGVSILVLAAALLVAAAAALTSAFAVLLIPEPQRCSSSS
jgi:hypothetical protein